MNPITIPGWAIPWLGIIAAFLSIASIIANATSHITEAEIEATRKQSPRAASLLTWARHWGIVILPGIKSLWGIVTGAQKYVAPIVIILFAMTMHGCGAAQRSWSDNAHIGVNLSTHGLRDADTAITLMYADQARRAHTIADLDAVDARFHPALEAEQVALASMHAAEHAIDTAIASGRSEDKCIVSVLLLRARTHTDDAISIARALGVPIADSTVASLSTIDTVLAALAPACNVSSASPAPLFTPATPVLSSGGSL